MKSGGGDAASPTVPGLAGRVCLVTGSSRGIGREIASILLAGGCSVGINGRDPDRLYRTRDTLLSRREENDTTAPLLAIPADAGTEEGARQLVEQTREHFGRIDVLINNAGVSMRGRIADLRENAIDHLYRGNILSAVLPTVAAMGELERTGGTVVFVSTVAALWGFPGVSMYSATKAGVETFARALDAEARTRGVRAKTVFLGFVENDPDKETLAADGTAFRHTRRAQQTQEQAALAIVRSITGRRRRVITIPAGRLLDRAARFAPGLVALVLSRSAGRLHRS